MEVMTIYEGLRLAKEEGWTNITIESDAQVVSQQISGGTTRWRISAKVSNIRALANQIEQV